jgi:hypothetical protein
MGTGNCIAVVRIDTRVKIIAGNFSSTLFLYPYCSAHCPVVDSMGRRPLPAVRDLTRDGRWSTYDVRVLKLYTLKLPSPTKLARLGHFPPASQAGRHAGPVFYVYVFSLVDAIRIHACQRVFIL